MLDKLTAEVFTSLLDQIFLVYIEDYVPIELQLIQVTDRSQFTSGKVIHEMGQRMPFNLLFRSAPDIYLPQHIYHMENARMEPLDLFIVPVGPDKRGMLYEAVFS